MAAAPKKAENITISARLRRIDPVLLLAALALSGIGILAVYVADTDYQQYYAVNQAMGLVAGLVLDAAASPPSSIRRARRMSATRLRTPRWP